jgi:hypothetical protein
MPRDEASDDARRQQQCHRAPWPSDRDERKLLFERIGSTVNATGGLRVLGGCAVGMMV